MDVSILHPCSACVGHTTLSAVEMSVAQHSPCLGGGERKTFPCFVGLLDFKLACEKQGLSGRFLLREAGKGKEQRTRAVEDRSVVLRLFCCRGIAQMSSCGWVMPPKLSGDSSEHPMPTGLHWGVQPPIPPLDLILSIAPARRCNCSSSWGKGLRGAGWPSCIRRAHGAQRSLKEAGFSPSLFPNRSAQMLETCLLSHPSCAAMSQDTF